MSTDLFPTLLEMSGLPVLPTKHVDGVSLFSSISAEVNPHEALFWHYPHYHSRAITPGGAVRRGDLKLLEWFEDGKIELYDLSTDIGERNDLSLDRPEEAAQLLETLHEWRNEIGANMPTRR